MYKNLARSFTTVLIGTALSAGMLASANPTQAAPTQAAEPAGDLQKSSLLEFLNHSDESGFDRDWSDLDIVEGAIRTVLKANPDSELAVVKDGSAAITAFLPTDRAFRRLVTDLTGTTYRNEQRVFNVLRNSDDVDAIESVLLYHVVQGDRVRGDDLIVSQAGTLTTAKPHFRVVCL